MDMQMPAGMNAFLSKPIDRVARVNTLQQGLPPVAPDAATARLIPAATSPPEPAPQAEDLPEISGIDLATTVKRLGIPFASLKPMYLRFADGQRKTLDDLKAAVAAGDADAARHHAHAIAGAAGNLGADTIRYAAKALGLAAQERQTNLSELLDAVIEPAHAVMTSIERLRAPAVKADPADDAADAPCDKAAVAKSLAPLAAAVDASDVTGCERAFDALRKLAVPDAMQRMLVSIGERMSEYEYGEAARLIADMRKQLD